MTRLKQYLIDNVGYTSSVASLMQTTVYNKLTTIDNKRMPDCINNINMRANGATNYFIYKA